MLPDDVQLISVDDHVIEHARVWLDRLPAKDPDLAKAWITAHLLLALLIDDTAAEMAESFPSGHRTSRQIALA